MQCSSDENHWYCVKLSQQKPQERVREVACKEIEANTHVANSTEPGISDAGDRNVISNMSNSSSKFLKALILVLLPGRSEPHMVLSVFCYLKKSAASFQPALIVKHFLR